MRNGTRRTRYSAVIDIDEGNDGQFGAQQSHDLPLGQVYGEDSSRGSLLCEAAAQRNESGSILDRECSCDTGGGVFAYPDAENGGRDDSPRGPKCSQGVFHGEQVTMQTYGVR
jgi:hypothetical protein